LYCHIECFGTYCGPECQKKCDDFQTHVDKHGIKMLFLLFGSMLFLVPTLAFGELFYMGAMLASMGLVIIIFPFGTGDSVQMWGLRKTVRIVRILGLAMALIGLLMMLLLQSF